MSPDPPSSEPVLLDGLLDEGLGVAVKRAARGGVPVVADGRGSNEMIDDRSLVELIADASECKPLEEVLAISRDDAGGFLTAVLKGVEA